MTWSEMFADRRGNFMHARLVKAFLADLNVVDANCAVITLFQDVHTNRVLFAIPRLIQRALTSLFERLSVLPRREVSPVCPNA
jgi:gluconate kinase